MNQLKLLKIYLILFIILFFNFGGFFLSASAANPTTTTTTCREKYLDSTGQCLENCSSFTDSIADNSTGLCSTDLICCHQVASSSGVASSIELQVPLFEYALAANLPEYILSIYRYALIIIVPLAIIMIITGGIFWISAAGNNDKINKAKKYIIDSFIGLGIALFSYIFLSLIGITTLKLPGLQTIDRLEGDALQIYEQSPASYTPSASGGGSEAVLDKNAPTNIVTIEVETIGGTKKVQVNQSIADKVKKTMLDLKNAGFNVVKLGGYRVQNSGCHPKGMALDINENNNGCFNCYGTKGSIIPSGATFNTGTDPLSFTEKIVNIIKSNGWCWGGDWDSFKDMHHFSSKSPLCQAGECAAKRPYNWSQSFEKNLNP